MSTPVTEKGQAYLTANANRQCFTGPGELIGIFVSSASNTPLLTVNDAIANSAGNVVSSNGNTIVPEFVPTSATFYRMPMKLTQGLNVTISGNVTCSIIANKG